MSSSEDIAIIGANEWLAAVTSACDAGDVTAFSDLFLENGWLRDLLCFSWNFHVKSGRDQIIAFLSENVGETTRFVAAGLQNFTLDILSSIGAPKHFSVPGNPDAKALQGAFKFTIKSPAARGRGYFRIINVEAKWKAFTMFTNMEDLVGHEEPVDRPLGLYGEHMTTWQEFRQWQIQAIEKDPTALILGGGQSGLMCAARLNRMGIRVLVIEKMARIGDVWRERYPNLTLHTTAHHCSLLYHPYPKTFPKFIPKEKIADFLEGYAKGQDIHIWLSSVVLPSPTYNSATGRWSVDVDHAGLRVNLNPKHIVIALGNGQARIPNWPGMDEFRGDLYHSDHHKGAEPYRGKKVVVVGACNAAADICQDFVAKGASEVTMVQRGATCVISSSTADKALFGVLFSEGQIIEDADFVNHSLPHALAMKLAAEGGTERLKTLDKKLHDGLTKAGFKLTWELTPGGGQVGLIGFFFERTSSGTMLDIGCGQLIIDGKIKIKQGVEVTEIVRDGIIFQDGSKIAADVIILATGNQPIINNAIDVFGEKIVDKIGPKIWGLDEEGELRGCYRPTGQPGLWFAPGAFQHSRFFSKHLALQILAQELGLKAA